MFTQPVYYASPTSAPVMLKMPSGANSGVAYGISSTGAIVGSYSVNSSQFAAYWANKDATAIALPIGSFASFQTAKFIDDNGEIFGEDTSKWIKWSTPTTAPVAMNPGTNSNQTYISSVTAAGIAVGGYLNPSGNGDHPGIWAVGSTSVTDEPYVTGFTDALMDSMNASGNGGGYQRNSSNVVTAWVKLGSTVQPLQGLVSNAGGYSFFEAKFIDANSDLYVLASVGSNYKWVYLKKN